jgi:excisionase family DNA binding protein
MIKQRHKAQSNSPAPSVAPKFYTRKEAAYELRMSLAKLDRVIARKKLKAKKHGRSVVVMATDIDKYIESWPDV